MQFNILQLQRIIYVDVGSYGKDSDSTIFQESSVWKSLLNNELGLPEENYPRGTNNPKVRAAQTPFPTVCGTSVNILPLI